MDESVARSVFAGERVVRLATVRAGGGPHLVPVVFAMVWDPADVIVTAVDHKPKSTRNLLRLRNIAGEPRTCFLADGYADDDWSALWWVRADTRAAVVRDDDPRRTTALAALAAKYPQYQEVPPDGAVIWAVVHRWRWWSAVG
jgi:PPOX class probable F420-dependent enzyme